MQGKLKDIQGHTFSRLTVIRRAENSTTGQARWWCRCACGGEVIVFGSALRNGNTRSCGCLRKEASAVQGKKAARHGMRKSPEYRTWRNMHERCSNHRHVSFKNYGGRGIKVSKRWLKFENFLKDMGLRPSQGYTLDRKNPDGHYTKKNCRWATQKEQQNNRRNNVILAFRGKTQTMRAWADEYRIPYPTFKWRIWRGWPMSHALGLG